LLKTSLDWYIASKPADVAIGISYTYGDNPKEGFRKFEFKAQQIFAIALKVELD
jgi:hypothetical protein